MANKRNKRQPERDIKEIIEEVRLENPIRQLLASHGVSIKGDRFIPFCHSSKSRKYDGKLDDYHCYCFVCGKKMDCYDIVEHFDGITDRIEQIRFLRGDDGIDGNGAKRLEAQKRMQELARQEAEKEALRKELRDKTSRIHELRSTLRKNKPESGSWPSKEWTDAYNELQVLDCQVATLLGDKYSGGDLSHLEEATF